MRTSQFSWRIYKSPSLRRLDSKNDRCASGVEKISTLSAIKKNCAEDLILSVMKKIRWRAWTGKRRVDTGAKFLKACLFLFWRETSLSIVIKNLNNKVNFSERASCGAVKTLSALSAISGGLRTGDWSKAEQETWWCHHTQPTVIRTFDQP